MHSRMMLLMMRNEAQWCGMIQNGAQWAGSVGADRVSSETGIVGVKLARVSLQAPLGPTNPRQPSLCCSLIHPRDYHDHYHQHPLQWCPVFDIATSFIAPFSDFKNAIYEISRSGSYATSKRTATFFRETIPKFPFNTGLFCIIFAAYRPRFVQGMKYCGWVRERSSLHEKTCSAGDAKGVGGITGINGGRLLMAK